MGSWIDALENVMFYAAGTDAAIVKRTRSISVSSRLIRLPLCPSNEFMVIEGEATALISLFIPYCPNFHNPVYLKKP